MKKTRFLFLLGAIIVSTLSSSSRGGPEPPAARESRQANPPAAAAGQERRPKILRLTSADYTVSVSSNGAITAEVHAFNRRAGREVAFMASDCIGVFNWVTKPPYALVADGTYQDTHCAPEAWAYGIFPNFRNVLWSCNWEPVTHWDYTEFGARNYQAAVAISNGWGDYCGFAAMSPPMKQKVLALFDWRKQFPTGFRPFDRLPVYKGNPVVKSIAKEAGAGISFLSWDMEGGDRVDTNLLRADTAVKLQFLEDGAWRDAQMKKRRAEDSGAASSPTVSATRVGKALTGRPGTESPAATKATSPTASASSRLSYCANLSSGRVSTARSLSDRPLPFNHKEFIATLGKFGVGTCLCVVGAGTWAAFGMMIWKD